MILKVLEEFALHPDRELDPLEWDGINESLSYIQDALNDADRENRRHWRERRARKEHERSGADPHQPADG